MNTYMDTDTSLQIVCPKCGAVNRVPADRVSDGPTCGKCHEPIAAGDVTSVTDATLPKTIEKSSLPVVVDFWAPWCRPCLAFAPTYAEIAKEVAGEAVLVKIDTDANPQSMMAHRVGSFPTFILFHEGKEVERFSGGMPKPMFLNWLREKAAELNG